MEPIKIEVILSDSALEGIKSLSTGMEHLNQSIQEQSTLVQNLNSQLVGLRAAFEEANAAGCDQEQNIDIVVALQQEVYILGGELRQLGAECTDTGAKSKKVLEEMGDNISALSDVMDIGVNVVELLGIKHDALSKAQERLQAIMAITQSMQKVAIFLSQQGFIANTTLTSSTNFLATATSFLGRTFSLTAVQAQVLMASLTLGFSAIISGIVAVWGYFSDKEKEAKEAAQQLAEAEKQQRESAAQTVVSQMVEYRKLQKAYNELGDDIKKKKQFVSENQEAFEKLGFSISDVKDAENLLIQGEDAFLRTITNRALMAASMEVAADKYKSAIATMMEADSDAEKDKRANSAQRAAKNQVAISLKRDRGIEDPQVIDTIIRGKGAEGYEDWMDKYAKLYQGVYDNVETELAKFMRGLANNRASAKRAEGDQAVQTGLGYMKEYNQTLEDADLKTSGDKKRKKNSHSTDPKQKRRSEIEGKILQKHEDSVQTEIDPNEDKFSQRTKQVQADFEKAKKDIEDWKKKLVDEISEENLYSGDELKSIQDRIDQAAAEALNKAEGKKLSEESKVEADKNKEKRELEYEVKLNSAEGFDRQLMEINHRYEGLMEKVKGDSTLENEVKVAQGRDVKIAEKKNTFDIKDRAEQAELHRQDILTKGLKMDEYVAQQRNKITLEYIGERLKALNGMTDEESLREIEQLNREKEKLESEDKRPKSLKGMFDEKAMSALKKHYQDLGYSATDAEEKATNFAVGFQDRMQLASEVVGGLKTAFGGLDEGLDTAMNAVGSVVDGFANGGLVGGITAAAGQVISITANLVGAKKEMDAGMIAHYETFMSVLNEMVDKQISMLDKLGGDQFGSNIAKTTKDIQSGIVASRKLLAEAASSGSSAGSHSLGYRANKTLEKYKQQLRAVGIYKTDWNKMTDEELVKLRSLPELYAHLPGDMRKYIDALAEGKEKLEQFNEEVQNTILGFGFSDITSMIVDSFTDSSIDNALDNLTKNVDGAIANIVKNMLARKMLTIPMEKMVDDLYNSMNKGNNVYELDTNAAKTFVDGVKNLGVQYGQAWEGIKESFKDAGIDFDADAQSSTSSQSGQTGAFTSMSQEQGTKLEGLFTSLQDHTSSIDYTTMDISRTMYAASDKLSEIARNTAYCVHLEQMAGDIAELKRDGIKMK